MTRIAPTGTPATSWLNSSRHRDWLDSEFRRLIEFGRNSSHPIGGFASLDFRGEPVTNEPVETYVTGRMTHVYALAYLRGVPGSGRMVDIGVHGLLQELRDTVHGGWFNAVDPDGMPKTDKTAYDHAFVALAAASASAAGHPDAAALLNAVAEILGERFWDDTAGMYRESFSRDWSIEEPYRGANSNMHLVESGLAIADVNGDDEWRNRSLRIAERLIHHHARSNGWRICEHFTDGWSPEREYNQDQPNHPFRPYGTTVGHWFEWSRLLLNLRSSLVDAPAWLDEAARELFDTAVSAAWACDGIPGFPYTLDWDDQPVNRSRMHWVIAEAIGAAAALRMATGESVFEGWYRAFWDHAASVFIDLEEGSWRHEVPVSGDVGTWSGKPDLYHAVQATLIPQLLLAPSLATQLARPDSGRGPDDAQGSQ